MSGRTVLGFQLLYQAGGGGARSRPGWAGPRGRRGRRAPASLFSLCCILRMVCSIWNSPLERVCGSRARCASILAPSAATVCRRESTSSRTPSSLFMRPCRRTPRASPHTRTLPVLCFFSPAHRDSLIMRRTRSSRNPRPLLGAQERVLRLPQALLLCHGRSVGHTKPQGPETHEQCNATTTQRTF